jgi:penicillin-binding protein 1C
MLLREALGRSLNVPAIRICNVVGVGPLLDRLHAAGFASLRQGADYYGLGLTLGNGEVTLLELAQGYAMFARGGLAVRAHGLAGVPEVPERVFSEQASYLITDILSDEMLRIKAFGAANPLLFDFPFAVKTGTSANWRDSWAVGYSSAFTVAVWAGDFSGATMNQISGAIGAGPLFNKAVTSMVYGSSVPHLPVLPRPPPGLELISVCPLSGGCYCTSMSTGSLAMPPPHISIRCLPFVNSQSAVYGHAAVAAVFPSTLQRTSGSAGSASPLNARSALRGHTPVR